MREVSISYVQIYNESLQDLLRPSSVVELREEAGVGVVLAGAEVRRVGSVDQCIRMIEGASCNRTTASTAMNDQAHPKLRS